MYLIDTNVLINILCAPQKLSKKVQEIVLSEDVLNVSIVSLWEIAIKQFIGKLNIESSIETIENICNERNINILQISSKEIEQTKQLPDIHRDPFDRLIISQAKINRFSVITSDSKFKLYVADVVEY